MDIKEIYESYKDYIDKEIEVEGWIKKHRKQKEIGFIDLSDGTCFKILQIVYDKSTKDFDFIGKIHYGSSVKVKGKIIKSPGKGQEFEMFAKEIELIGDCPLDYPLQPKDHSLEFFRYLLWQFTNTFNPMGIYTFMLLYLLLVIVKEPVKCFK